MLQLQTVHLPGWQTDERRKDPLNYLYSYSLDFRDRDGDYLKQVFNISVSSDTVHLQLTPFDPDGKTPNVSLWYFQGKRPLVFQFRFDQRCEKKPTWD
jgi:hypothetical protein